MDIAVQLMMGVSLAACAGLRAFLPLLVASLLAKVGYVTLNESFAFLVRDDVVLILAAATVLEIVGDKFIVVDHFLDAVGTVVRPAVGAVLTSSMLVEVDPAASVLLGLIAGGSVSFVVHAGKAMTRAKATLLAPLHGGVGNAGVSLAEDVAAIGGIFLAILFPVLAFLIAIAAVVFALWLARHMARTGVGMWRAVTRRRGPTTPGADGDAGDGAGLPASP